MGAEKVAEYNMLFNIKLKNNMKKITERFGYEPDMGNIGKILSNIQSNLVNYVTPHNLSSCIGYTDYTSLNSNDTPFKIISITQKVNEFTIHYPNYPSPASICVYPNFGKFVNDTLTVSGVDITTVAGSFPTSQSFPEVKRMECKLAVQNGANEIDIVLALNAFFDGDLERASQEIKDIKCDLGEKVILKVILETGMLFTPDNIASASFLAMEAGADFITTSTGKQETACTPMAAIVMCQSIKEFYNKRGKMVGFKATGGITTAKDALCYLAIVEMILGKEWLTPRYFRIGADRLINNLLSDLQQETVNFL